MVGVLGGCSSDPKPPEAELRAAEAKANEPAALPTEPTSPQVASLLPVDPQRVQWFRALRPGVAPRRVALFTAFDAQVQAPVLRSLGWSKGDGEVRLWPGPRAVWFWPQGLAETAYRVWAPTRSWDDGRGQRHGLEQVRVPLGVIEAVRTERSAGTLRVLHWLAPQRGLVRLEVLRNEERILTLELLSESTREGQGSLPRSTPEETWASILRAVEHFDWQGLEALVSPTLLRRLDGPRGAVEPLLGKPSGLPRLRAFLELGLERFPGLNPNPEGGVAHLRAGSRRGPVQLVFRADDGGWRWSGVAAHPRK